MDGVEGDGIVQLFQFAGPFEDHPLDAAGDAESFPAERDLVGRETEAPQAVEGIERFLDFLEAFDFHPIVGLQIQRHADRFRRRCDCCADSVVRARRCVSACSSPAWTSSFNLEAEARSRLSTSQIYWRGSQPGSRVPIFANSVAWQENFSPICLLLPSPSGGHEVSGVGEGVLASRNRQRDKRNRRGYFSSSVGGAVGRSQASFQNIMHFIWQPPCAEPSQRKSSKRTVLFSRTT